MKKIILAFSACFLLQSLVSCYPGPSEEELRAQEELDGRLNSILREARQISFQILLQESAKKYYRKIIAAYKKIKEEAESISLNRQKISQDVAKLEALLEDLRLDLGLDIFMEGDNFAEDYSYLTDKCLLYLDDSAALFQGESAAAGAFEEGDEASGAISRQPAEELKEALAEGESSGPEAKGGVFAVGFADENDPLITPEDQDNSGAAAEAADGDANAEAVSDGAGATEAASDGAGSTEAASDGAETGAADGAGSIEAASDGVGSTEAVSDGAETGAADGAVDEKTTAVSAAGAGAEAVSDGESEQAGSEQESGKPSGRRLSDLSSEDLTEFCLLLLEIIDSEAESWKDPEDPLKEDPEASFSSGKPEINAADESRAAADEGRAAADESRAAADEGRAAAEAADEG